MLSVIILLSLTQVDVPLLYQLMVSTGVAILCLGITTLLLPPWFERLRAVLKEKDDHVMHIFLAISSTILFLRLLIELIHHFDLRVAIEAIHFLGWAYLESKEIIILLLLSDVAVGENDE